jgi:HlyD family type I secretion membrane fusion protein
MVDTGFAWERGIASNPNGIGWAGYLAITLLVGTFGAWAALAPLSGAALAPGVIAAAGRNIMIQHLEGGIIQEILVTEGERVKAGQALVILDPTEAETQLNRLTTQLVTNQAMMARLTAERDGALSMAGPVETDAGSKETLDIFQEQNKEFQARLSRYTSEREILHQRVAALDDARTGLQSQQDAIAEQLSIVSDELAAKKTLVDQGLTNRFEYTQILRNRADLIGQRGVVASEVATAITQRIEALEQLERLATQRVEEAVTRLNEVRTTLADLEDQLIAARRVLERTVISAPVDGIVVSSVYNSKGSVVAPGGEMLEILPTTEKVIVEARLNPQDIDIVKVGQTARLRLSALNMRLTPEVDGKVIHLSADRLVDEVTQEPYYRARIGITDNLPASVAVEQLYPGMPVEAFIETGERTFFEYLARPILDSFNRAFVEE